MNEMDPAGYTKCVCVCVCDVLTASQPRSSSSCSGLAGWESKPRSLTARSSRTSHPDVFFGLNVSISRPTILRTMYVYSCIARLTLAAFNCIKEGPSPPATMHYVERKRETAKAIKLARPFASLRQPSTDRGEEILERVHFPPGSGTTDWL